MSNEESRRYVQSGLNRRKEERVEAAREKKLEQYELEQIRFCNEHYSDAKMQRKMEETNRINRQKIEERHKAMAEARAMEAAREMAAISAVRKYVIACLVILCLTIFTYLPLWAAATCIFGLAIFPAAYIFRLYYPIDRA